MIKSISFLVTPDEREHVKATKGKFTLTKKGISGRITRSRSFGAKDFVEYVRNRDPFITLNSGEKLRVYRGGHPDDEVIETISIIEKYDELLKQKEYLDQMNFADYGSW